MEVETGIVTAFQLLTQNRIERYRGSASADQAVMQRQSRRANVFVSTEDCASCGDGVGPVVGCGCFGCSSLAVAFMAIVFSDGRLLWGKICFRST
jgi:hypothetical protein